MIILYKCNLCGNSIKKYCATGQKMPGFLQCECSGILEKQLPEFSTSSFETVDNGNMHKKVELRKDAVELARGKGDAYIKQMEDRAKVVKKNET